jgi:hypothetical protein
VIRYKNISGHAMDFAIDALLLTAKPSDAAVQTPRGGGSAERYEVSGSEIDRESGEVDYG